MKCLRCGSKRCHKFLDATTPVKGDLPMTLEKSFGTEFCRPVTLILLSRFRSFHAFLLSPAIGTVVSSSNSRQQHLTITTKSSFHLNFVQYKSTVFIFTFTATSSAQHSSQPGSRPLHLSLRSRVRSHLRSLLRSRALNHPHSS